MFIAVNVSLWPAPYQLAGLTNGTPYYLAISSLNSVGAESTLTQEITVTPVSKYAVHLTIAGTGKGSVMFPQGGTSCNSNCTVLFDPYTTIILQDSPEQYSLFKGWTGACTATSGNCPLTMDSDKTITARFDKGTDYSVVVDLPAVKYYPSISAAYLETSAPAVLKAWGTDFTENLLFNKAVAVTLKGGFNEGYSANSGTTTLHGTIRVRRGKLTLEKVILR